MNRNNLKLWYADRDKRTYDIPKGIKNKLKNNNVVKYFICNAMLGKEINTQKVCIFYLLLLLQITRSLVLKTTQIYSLIVLEVWSPNDSYKVKPECDGGSFWGCSKNSISWLSQLLKTSHSLPKWSLPLSFQSFAYVITVSTATVKPPSTLFQNTRNYTGSTRIIQDNLKILNWILSTNALLPFMIIYSQVKG